MSNRVPTHETVKVASVLLATTILFEFDVDGETESLSRLSTLLPTESERERDQKRTSLINHSTIRTPTVSK